MMGLSLLFLLFLASSAIGSESVALSIDARLSSEKRDLQAHSEQSEYPGLGVFALIIVPLSLLIGLATATVGFTSWSILVPLLWVGFDIDVYDALLTAIASDCLNATFLSIVYATQGRVQWRQGITFGFIACAPAVGCLFAAKIVIDMFKEYIKKGLGYVVIFIALTFVLRGYRLWRRDRDEAAEFAADQLSQGEQSSEGSSLMRPPSAIPPPQSYSAANTHPNSTLSSSGFVAPYLPVDGNGTVNISSMLTETQKITLVPTTELLSRDLAGWEGHEAYTSDDSLTGDLEALHGTARPVPWIRQALMAVLVALSGAASGLIGIGSGMNFVMSYLYVMDYDLLHATATGCFNMALVMLAVLMGYLGIMPLHLSTLYPFLLITLVCGLVGTMLGAFLSAKISPILLNFVIALLLILVGVGAVVEPYFLHWFG